MEIFKRWHRFILVFLTLLLSVLLLESTRTRTEKEAAPVMRAAAQKTEEAFRAVKEEKHARGFPISPTEDLNQTGLIGASYTEITTTLGSLESKRSTTNPNTAAMVTDMLLQCGVSAGDTVAVNLSSSFPCLNLAVVCSLDAIGADGIIINSVGASTYGANLPEFTYLDMEHLLLEQGLITNHSRWFSMGGADDVGKEMPQEIKADIRIRLTGYGLTFLEYEDMEENLEARGAIYQAAEKPACFINVGGNLLSFGGGSEMVSAHNGIIRPKEGQGGTGLIPMFLSENVPVIHLLDMKSLLPAWGLPFDPSPVPKAGSGDVYYYEKYNTVLAWTLLAGNLLLLFWAIRNNPHKKMPL